MSPDLETRTRRHGGSCPACRQLARIMLAVVLFTGLLALILTAGAPA